MAENVTPRVRVPATAAVGEEIVIKTLISHPMESGLRKDADGALVPRSIINRFEVTFNGESVIDVEMEPGFSSNPYFEFVAKVPGAGTFAFAWHDDDGSVYRAVQDIAIA